MRSVNNKPLLTISILCSTSDLDTFKKCLDSLDSLRKNVRCELILTDTGMSAECLSYAESKADRILKFSWINDFSAARNVGLKEASGSWFMFLDDDEWFESTKEIENFLNSDEVKDFGSLSYFVRNYTDSDGTNYNVLYTSRCGRITKNSYFHGKIHELLTPFYGPTKYLNDYVHHYGYVFADQEAMDKKHKRNTLLLRQMMKEEPDNLRWPKHYANELYATGNYYSLHDFCEAMIAKDLRYKDPAHLSDCELYYCAIISSSIRIEDYDSAAKELNRAFSHKNNKYFTLAKLAYLGAIIYFEKKDYDFSIKYAKKYEQYIDLFDKTDDNYKASVAFFTNDIKNPSVRNGLYSILASDALMMNDTELAKYALNKIIWDKTQIYTYGKQLAEIFVDKVSEGFYYEGIEKHIERIFTILEIDAANEVKELEKKDHYSPNVKKIFAQLAPLSNGDQFFTYVVARNIYINAPDATKREKSDALKNYCKSAPDFLLADNELYLDAEKSGVKISEVFDSIYFPKFQYAVDSLCAAYKVEVKTNEDKEWHEAISRRFPMYESYFGASRSRHHCYFKLMAMLAHMAVDTEGIEPETVKQYFFEYWNTCLFYADGIYALDSVTPENEAFDHLPDFLQAGIFLYHASLDEKAENMEALKRDILKACDRRNELKKWAEILVGPEEEKLRDKEFEKNAKEGNVEFDDFAEKIINDSKYLISQGQIIEAKRNLTGLLAMMPGDERITELLKNL